MGEGALKLATTEASCSRWRAIRSKFVGYVHLNGKERINCRGAVLLYFDLSKNNATSGMQNK